jgi:hypothetical protein
LPTGAFSKERENIVSQSIFNRETPHAKINVNLGVMARKRKHAERSGGDAQPPTKKVASDPLPDGVHHYQHLNEVPWDIQK